MAARSTISVLEISGGVFEVRQRTVTPIWEAEDIDALLADYIATEFKKTSGIDVTKDRMALQRIREAAEKAKCELSSTIADRNQPSLHCCHG